MTASCVACEGTMSPMTHEYTVATNGIVLGGSTRGTATALAWAEDTILAVGDDTTVRAVSRGDSTFVDLAGRAVSAGLDPADATEQMREAVRRGDRELGVAALEPGSPADLLIWSHDPRGLDPGGADLLHVVGTVVGGHLSWQAS
jgi:predicted amidohydrolase YtcJ